MRSLILQNAHILRGTSCQEERADIEVRSGRITRIAPAGTREATLDGDTLDLNGMYVSAGWIDLHVHVFEGMGVFSLRPSDVGLRRGVTTMLDTGTAGALTYPGFERFISRGSSERVFALLNTSIIGALHGYPTVQPFMGEYCDARYADLNALLTTVRQHPDYLVGFKVRLTDILADHIEANERAGLHAAQEASSETGLPFMVHHHNSLLSPEEVLGSMRQGDILTHLYNPSRSRPFAANGEPLDCLLEARQRGVLLDVGHGIGSFAWKNAETAIGKHGLLPDTISTDLHQFCLAGPVFDLATTLTKFLYLGMSLSEVIAGCTVNAARALGKGDLLGVLEEGREADLTIFRLEEGNWPLYDAFGDARHISRRIRPEFVVKSGELVNCAAPAPVVPEAMRLVAKR